MIVAAAAAMFVTVNALAARPPAVSAEPALKPNQPNHRRPGAEDGHRHVMGLLAVAIHVAPADHERDDERRDARADVDDRAAGEVEGAELEQPAIDRPHPVGDRRVDEDRPQDREENEGTEPLALGEGASDEGRRDRREHQLEHREQHERDRRCVDS